MRSLTFLAALAAVWPQTAAAVPLHYHGQWGDEVLASAAPITVTWVKRENFFDKVGAPVTLPAIDAGDEGTTIATISAANAATYGISDWASFADWGIRTDDASFGLLNFGFTTAGGTFFGFRGGGATLWTSFTLEHFTVNVIRYRPASNPAALEIRVATDLYGEGTTLIAPEPTSASLALLGLIATRRRR